METQITPERLVTDGMLSVKEIFVPYLQTLAHRCLTDNSWRQHKTEEGEFDIKTRFVRNFERHQECDDGKVNYDVCSVLTSMFFQKDRRIEEQFVNALRETYDAHHVRVERFNQTDNDGKIKHAYVLFLFDWNSELGFDALVRLWVSVKPCHAPILELEFSNKKEKLRPLLN